MARLAIHDHGIAFETGQTGTPHPECRTLARGDTPHPECRTLARGDIPDIS
jgi:hypothetical protein